MTPNLSTPTRRPVLTLCGGTTVHAAVIASTKTDVAHVQHFAPEPILAVIAEPDPIAMPHIGPNEKWALAHLPNVRMAAVILTKTDTELCELCAGAGIEKFNLMCGFIGGTAEHLLDICDAMHTAIQRLHAASIAAGIAAAKPATEPDPAFAAIERHTAALDAIVTAVNDDLPDALGSALSSAECNAMRDLLRTEPSTVAGAIAMLRYLATYDGGDCNFVGLLMKRGSNDETAAVRTLLGSIATGLATVQS